ncbi:hypothetical protein GGI12_004740 [Dipsacomyces acuminosporus]|nr:hypothetical protein GGI12_004740 [Dipsacomyces acuminosporus]
MCQLAVCPWLKLISPRANRRFNQQAERWFCLLLLAVTELWAPTKLVMTGDKDLINGGDSDGSNQAAGSIREAGGSNWFVPATEDGCMMISNHQTYFDWILIWFVSYFEQCDGFMKIILKNDFKHVPVFGWGMQFIDFIFLKRKWADDQRTFTDHMRRIVEHDDPAWLLIFPEGTVICKKRTELSNKYAEKVGLRKPENTLLPRVLGSHFCLSRLRSKVPYVYDLTVGYEGLKKGDIPEDEYGLVSMYGKAVYPREVHIHVKRYAVADIPEDEEGFTKWMNEVFVEKDKRMEAFYKLGRFPHNSTEDSSIPEGQSVLQMTKKAKAGNLPLEAAAMWLQILSVLTPAYYILKFASASIASLAA